MRDVGEMKVHETALGKLQAEEIAKYQKEISEEKLGRSKYWSMIERICRDGDTIPSPKGFIFLWLRYRVRCPLCGEKITKGRMGQILTYSCVKCEYRYAEGDPNSYY